MWPSVTYIGRSTLRHFGGKNLDTLEHGNHVMILHYDILEGLLWIMTYKKINRWLIQIKIGTLGQLPVVNTRYIFLVDVFPQSKRLVQNVIQLETSRLLQAKGLTELSSNSSSALYLPAPPVQKDTRFRSHIISPVWLGKNFR